MDAHSSSIGQIVGHPDTIQMEPDGVREARDSLGFPEVREAYFLFVTSGGAFNFRIASAGYNAPSPTACAAGNGLAILPYDY